MMEACWAAPSTHGGCDPFPIRPHHTFIEHSSCLYRLPCTLLHKSTIRLPSRLMRHRHTERLHGSYRIFVALILLLCGEIRCLQARLRDKPNTQYLSRPRRCQYRLQNCTPRTGITFACSELLARDRENPMKSCYQQCLRATTHAIESEVFWTYVSKDDGVVPELKVIHER
jgi:hypothetical protein